MHESTHDYYQDDCYPERNYCPSCGNEECSAGFCVSCAANSLRGMIVEAETDDEKARLRSELYDLRHY